MRRINRRDQSKGLNHENKWRGEGAHERKPVGRTDQQINQRHRPGEKDEDLEQICERTTAKGVTAHRQKRSLQNESARDREKVKPGRPKDPGAQLNERTHNRCQEADY